MEGTSAQRDAAARKALKYFHDEASKYPDNYTLTFDELIIQIQSIQPTFLDFFGNALLIAQSLSDADIRRVMYKLADEGEGRIPSAAIDLNAFLSVLGDEYGDFNFSNWKRVVSAGVADAGTTLVTASKWALGGTAVLAVGALGLIIFLKFGGSRN